MLILRTLDSLNTKMDRVLSPEPESISVFPPSGQNFLDEFTAGTITNTSAESNVQEAKMTDVEMSSAPEDRSVPGIPPQKGSLKSFQVPARQAKQMQSLLGWPAVQTLLACEGVNLSQWNGQRLGTESWLISISKDFPEMATDPPMNIRYSEFGAQSLEGSHSIHLNKAHVESLCEAYFKTFHCTYPILDINQFYNSLLPRVCSQSFSEADDASALVLLVLAVGSVARESVNGNAFVDEAGRETGVRGGTILRPPGHVFLTEAKRRLGLELTSWNLNSLRCTILFSCVFILLTQGGAVLIQGPWHRLYYAQISRNLVSCQTRVLVFH